MSYQSNYIIEENGYLINEFIQENNINMLDDLYNLISSNLKLSSDPKLELCEFTKKWKTLFIKVECYDTYEHISNFHIKFIDKLFEYPSMIEFINIDFIHVLNLETINQLKFIDWNELSLDKMVDYLKDKHKFSSTDEAKCIFSLIDFYERNKKITLSENKIRSILELACYEDSNHDVWGKDTYLGTMDELIKEANILLNK
jgi:hypothetical protein